MPVVKYVAVHSSPLSMLKYITREEKGDNTRVSGLNIAADVQTAYEELKIGFEHFSGQRFYKRSLNRQLELPEKEPVRLHHYIQSFAPGEVTAEEAHKIGIEWAEKVFGLKRAVVVSTHCEKGHIHNHFAVAVFDSEGQRWYGNKETLKMCRAVSDEIARAHGLSVIENPKYRPNQRYSEHQARKSGNSWKQKLCDDIDSLILKPEVTSIAELAEELKAMGYTITLGKHLSIKARPNRKAIRSFRLGDGYSIEHLAYRIANKNMEMPLSEAMRYEGVQREYALCIRQIQIEIYRTPESGRLHFATYREVEQSLKILNFISENKITSVDSFEMKVSAAEEILKSLRTERNELLKKIKNEEAIISAAPRFFELRSKSPLLAEDIKELAGFNFVKDAGVRKPEDIEAHRHNEKSLKEQLADLDEKIKNASDEHRTVSGYYKTYNEKMKSDYQIMLERAKAEIENRQTEEARQKAEIEKLQNGQKSENSKPTRR